MSNKRSQEGYLLIDHRASPGLPADFARSIGLGESSLGEGRVFETSTVTCCHCGVVVMINPMRTRSRGHCQKCDAYVCDNPSCHAGCTPFAKILDAAESVAYRAGQSVIGESNFTLRKELHNV